MSRWEIRLAIGLLGSILASGMAITSQAAAFSQASEVTATSVLMTLPVKGRAAKTGYTRAQFGQTWADVDRNGCDTRNDMLKRDLTEIVFKIKTRNCVVERGVLLDRYSGETINPTKNSGQPKHKNGAWTTRKMPNQHFVATVQPLTSVMTCRTVLQKA